MERKSNNNNTTSKRRRKNKNGKSKSIISRTWNSLAGHTPERSMPGVDNKPYKIVQSALRQASFATSASVPSFQSYGFAFSDLDQYTSFTAVFDQYKITGIEFWLIPQAPAVLNAGEVATVVDYDDTTNLSTFAAAEDYQNCQVGKTIEGHYRKFVPHIAVAAYSGAFTSFMNLNEQWIDCSYPGVLHYGVKVASTVTTNAATFDALIRYHVSFRNVR